MIIGTTRFSTATFMERYEYSFFGIYIYAKIASKIEKKKIWRV